MCDVVDFDGGFGPDIFYKEYIKNKFTLKYCLVLK